MIGHVRSPNLFSLSYARARVIRCFLLFRFPIRICAANPFSSVVCAYSFATACTTGDRSSDRRAVAADTHQRMAAAVAAPDAGASDAAPQPESVWTPRGVAGMGMEPVAVAA